MIQTYNLLNFLSRNMDKKLIKYLTNGSETVYDAYVFVQQQILIHQAFEGRCLT